MKCRCVNRQRIDPTIQLTDVVRRGSHANDKRIAVPNRTANSVARDGSVVDLGRLFFLLILEIRESNHVMRLVTDDDVEEIVEAGVVIFPHAKLRIGGYNDFS